MDQSEYPSLRTALDKLTLNDSSVSLFQDSSVSLGQGWRIGFLGLLHMDVFRQRLEEVCVHLCMSIYLLVHIIMYKLVCVCVCALCVCVCIILNLYVHMLYRSLMLQSWLLLQVLHTKVSR